MSALCGEKSKPEFAAPFGKRLKTVSNKGGIIFCD